MKRQHIYIIALLCVVAAGLWFWKGRGSSEDGDATADPSGEARPDVPKLPEPKGDRQASRPAAAGQMTRLTMDADPVGNLRLEGLVLDQDELPVAGATVYLSSRPPQTAVSGEDGTFAFEKLVGRRYSVSARKGARVGGPLVHELTAKSDPVVIRVEQGASIEVTVVDRDGGAPISGATVGLQGMGEASATTDGDGVATIEGVRSGWELLVVRASGYATSREPLRVPDAAGFEMEKRIELEQGTSVSGVVVDEDGEPVKDARVVPRSAAAPFSPIDVFGDGTVTTNAKGEFTIDGLGFGSYHFLAFHERYAPGSSDHVALSESHSPAVEIVLSEGGVVAGTVFDAGGEAVPWAQVQLVSETATRSGWGGGGISRQVVAGEDGTFRVTGLPREKLSILARSSEASSPTTDVNLAATRVVEDLELVLSITGTISGVVVDGAGEPVPEAQVMATPDFWAGADQKEMQVRGSAFATTDGGGRFAIRGLTEGAYLLRASRGEMTTQGSIRKPAKAETGDTGVRIVLLADGAVKGKVATHDGEVPEVAYASIAWAGMVPVVEGEFRIDGIPPGTYDVSLRGSFPQRTVKDVEIEPGETRDLGTVKVDPGREITGRVTTAGGAPIEGARVALGEQLVGDAANLVTSLDEATMQAMGLRRTKSGPNGEFRFAGLGPEELAIAAEHPEHGRSRGHIVPRGDGDVAIDLPLRPFGALKGEVIVNGVPAPDLNILVNTASGARQIVAARSARDGSFVFDRLAAGDYKVTAMLGSGASADMIAQMVTVKAGETTEVTLSKDQGNLTVDILVNGKDGARVDAAQVFLFGNPEVSAETGGELNQQFLAGNQAGDAKMSFANAGAPAHFEKVSPGEHALCVVPITGDMNDPTFAQRLQENAMDLAVYCNPLTLPSSPAEQTHDVAVPAMTPF